MNNLKLSLRLLGDFRRFLEKRTTFFLVYYLLPKILEWYLYIWEKEIVLLGDDDKNLELWSEYSQLEVQLDGILGDITGRVMSEDSMDAYTFFDTFSKHAEKNKDKVVKMKDQERFYVVQLLGNFYNIFFSKIETSPNRFHIWNDYFPSQWKITKHGLENNIIQRITAGKFFEWAIPRISENKKEPDLALDSVVRELFPQVEPMAWAAVLIFVFSYFGSVEKVKLVIEKDWTFGFGGRVRSFMSSYSEKDDASFENHIQTEQVRMYESEFQQTIELVSFLAKIDRNFYFTFSKDNLEAFLKQAEELRSTYEKDSVEENRRRKLEAIFRALI